MRSGASILAGLLAGVIVALGILAAFVFVGPDPVGLRPTPTPTLPSPVAAASASASPSAASGGLTASVAGSPAGSPVGSPSGSDASQTGFHVGEPAPALVVPQLGGVASVMFVHRVLAALVGLLVVYVGVRAWASRVVGT